MRLVSINQHNDDQAGLCSVISWAANARGGRDAKTTRPCKHRHEGVNSITSGETYQLHPVHLVLIRRGELLVGGDASVDPCYRVKACPWRRD
jgi:hypothetical protein